MPRLPRPALVGMIDVVDMISFGSVFLELVFGHVPALPVPGQEIFTDDFAISCGGAVSSATAARRSGVTAGLCTLLGDDLGSRVVIEHCEREGVDLSPAARVARRVTGITTVFNYDGDRSFVTHVPPRPADEPAPPGRWISVLHQYRPAWCYLHAAPDRQDFLAEARQLGIKAMVDISLVGIGTAAEIAEVIECVRMADVFVPNQAELIQLTDAANADEAISVAAGWGTPVVMKRGAQGAVIASPDGICAVTEGVAQIEVADLTGAGDAFAGAMIGALVQGAPLDRAVVAANAAGSEAASRLGAVGPVEVEGLSTVLGPGRPPRRVPTRPPGHPGQRDGQPREAQR
jgi:sugar/nucleoside kinase (ribokinase family)